MAAAVDMVLASGASNINSLIAGFFIICLGTCRYTISYQIFGFQIPLLSLECGLSTRLLQCEDLVRVLLS